VTHADEVAAERLEFAHPDLQRFPCLALAFRALRGPAGLPVVLNAANEVAVTAFLERRLGFAAIADVIRSAMEAYERNGAGKNVQSLADVREIDGWARGFAGRAMAGVQSTS